VVEASNHLLFFPSNYEGMDVSSNIVCTGPIPNQQVIPAVNWCFEKLRARKYYLAGSHDIQSYSCNALIKDQLKAMGGQPVGEKYIGQNGTGVAEVVAGIKATGPDIVLSTVVGDDNKAFFQQMAQAGLNPARVPVLTFMIAEDELRELPVKEMIGDYAAWNYFQSIDNPSNRNFVQQFKALYGSDRTVSDALVAAYNAVKLWAQAVEEAGTDVTADVRNLLRRESLEAPEGVVSIDSETFHTWRPFYIGKIRSDGQFEIVWSLEKPVRPVPYPILRTRADWETFRDKLYTTWGTSEFHPQTLTESPSPPTSIARRPASRSPATTLSGTRRPRSYQR
jgi:urea transport system substrate-binding protein